MPRARRTLVTELKGLLLAGAIGYLVVVVLVWFIQEQLMFFRVPASVRPGAPPGWTLEEVRHVAADGVRLAGWLARPPVERAPLVIYYGGNAEEVTAQSPLLAATYGERAVLLVNYRGYGASEGSPGERALVADALELHDWAAKRPDIDAKRIAVHGRSLGSGIAVQVASRRAVKCVVLTSPFDSALEVAKRVYPWLPVSLLMRHPFDSAALAPKITTPALVVYGEADTIVRPAHSQRLASLWGGPVERVALPGFGHNDLDLNPRYAGAIRAYLETNDLVTPSERLSA